MKVPTIAVSLLLVVAPWTAAQSEEIAAAVAANFTAAMQWLVPEFERASGHKVVTSFGATGKLYAQIKNGAPFDVFLCADDETPRRLETEGDGVTGTRYTYAIGRLALWSPKPNAVDERGDVLKTGDFTHIAIANPKTAPYGAAAEQVMRKLGVWEKLTPKLVQGENIAQTFQFVHSGNAQLGFVALAQVRALSATDRGSQWLVPETMHESLRQDAILLRRAADKPAARAFLDFLRSASARKRIEELGYTTTR
ncbi:MAG TPA: molybdate ABC transporter substrate-binding protein [Burkholderiales bacterium]|nr:molybdate ABC transporter substrate-binding protein [Burkholderiales bacterium]